MINEPSGYQGYARAEASGAAVDGPTKSWSLSVAFCGVVLVVETCDGRCMPLCFV